MASRAVAAAITLLALLAVGHSKEQQTQTVSAADVAAVVSADNPQPQSTSSSAGTSPELVMHDLSEFLAVLSPVFTKHFFTKTSPAYTFLYSNLAANNLADGFTFFYPTNEAFKKYNHWLQTRPSNCPVVPMRNLLAQAMVPGKHSADDLRALAKANDAGRQTLLKTMSPVTLTVSSAADPAHELAVTVENTNGYGTEAGGANIVKLDAITDRGYVVHLVDNVLTACQGPVRP